MPTGRRARTARTRKKTDLRVLGEPEVSGTRRADSPRTLIAALRRPIVGDMASPPPNESRPVAMQTAATDERVLDAKYAQLATALNAEVINAERRAARDTYIGRRER